MFKLICFDLDGVLCTTKQLHFEALNLALREYGHSEISEAEHLTKYDGLSTRKKLAALGIEGSRAEAIWWRKQELSDSMLDKYLKPSSKLYGLLSQLRAECKIACVSNAIRATVLRCLRLLKIDHLFDIVVASDDGFRNKPSPAMYLSAMLRAAVDPAETLIVEDSNVGLVAAKASGAAVFPVSNPDDVVSGRLEKFLESPQGNTAWANKKQPYPAPRLNVLIPMAGAGSRFAAAGYTFPKPLIEVFPNVPMIQAVVENLNIDANYIFLVQEEHYEKYNLGYVLNLIKPSCEIVKVRGMTQGAADTTLLAKRYINNDEPLLIANSDQIVDWDSGEFLYRMESSGADAGILTFPAVSPKWSYARLDSRGYVAEVAEKKPISNHATCGIYWFRYGHDYVCAAEEMMRKNIRVNGEFYVCPVFNEIIQDTFGVGNKVIIHPAKAMFGIGDPESLKSYLETVRKDTL